MLEKEKIAEYLEYAEKEAFPLSQKKFLLEKNLQKVRDLEKRYNTKTKGVI